MGKNSTTSILPFEAGKQSRVHFNFGKSDGNVPPPMSATSSSSASTDTLTTSTTFTLGEKPEGSASSFMTHSNESYVFDVNKRSGAVGYLGLKRLPSCELLI
jgi:hypothetical protein